MSKEIITSTQNKDYVKFKETVSEKVLSNIKDKLSEMLRGISHEK